jgi:hypothetical protein
MASSTRALTAIALTGAALLAAPACAQGLDDKYWAEVGFYWPKVDTTIQVSSVTNSTIGTEVDFEDDLDFGDGEGLPSFTAGARLSRRFLVVGEYYSLGRSSETTLARDIVFDDVTYPVSATVSSEFDSSIYRFSVGYSFVRKPNMELGGAIGLHATDFGVALEGMGTVGGSTTQIVSRRREALAPLPTIGIYGTYEVAPRVELAGNVDYLSLSLGDYDGRLVNAQASVSYRVFKNVGVGVMYRYVDYRLDVEKEDWVGRLTYQFSGPAVFLIAGF